MNDGNPGSLQYSWCKEKNQCVQFHFFLEMVKVFLIFTSNFKLL